MSRGIGKKRVPMTVKVNISDLEEKIAEAIQDEIERVTSGSNIDDYYEEDGEIIFECSYVARVAWEHFPQTWDEPEENDEDHIEYVDEKALEIVIRKAIADNINLIKESVDISEDSEWIDEY